MRGKDTRGLHFAAIAKRRTQRVFDLGVMRGGLRMTKSSQIDPAVPVAPRRTGVLHFHSLLVSRFWRKSSEKSSFLDARIRRDHLTRRLTLTKPGFKNGR